MAEKEPFIEKICFPIMEDKDELTYLYSHSDRFLVIVLKDRKDILSKEYRPNPYGKICREKYPEPTALGDKISEEELELYRNMAEIVKDCTYVYAKNFGYYPFKALEKAGTDYIMANSEPWEKINWLIKDRAFAGFKDD
ncbi:MAG TPA: hypothetical protein VJL89_02390 [Thermodesulfovibrionia bacterium]|nr:hypothetical protein [Thermodesulfovibrionia bacterium]